MDTNYPSMLMSELHISEPTPLEYTDDLTKITVDLQIALTDALHKPFAVKLPGGEQPGPWLTDGYSKKFRELFEEKDSEFQRDAFAWYADKTPEHLAILAAYFSEMLH